MDDLGDLSPPQLRGLLDAAQEVKLCQRTLAKTGDNILTELLRGQGTIHEWRHYPPGDVYDAEFHAQYYYHCHPAEERKAGEHGHFHTFLRPLGMPDSVKPAPLPDYIPPNDTNEALSHLIGIGVSATGDIVRLFTTNRWVTGETWYAANDVIAMLDNFVIDHARPSWPVNRWITAVLRLFRPQIEALLAKRDVEIARRAWLYPGTNIFDDRELEIPSEIQVSTLTQIAQVEQAWRTLRRAGGKTEAGRTGRLSGDDPANGIML